MRKSWLFIVAGVLAGTAGAGAVPISGKHGVGEIAATCASVGGTFIPQGLGGDYGCTKSCGDGGTCEVFCDKEGICEGSCPACGERRQRRGPVPVLRGAQCSYACLKQLNDCPRGRAGVWLRARAIPGRRDRQSRHRKMVQNRIERLPNLLDAIKA